MSHYMNHEIINSYNILKKGKILLYPTDTVWAIGCDATNYLSVNKIFSLKKRNSSKAMIILVDSLISLSKIVEINFLIKKIIKIFKRPLTIIYNNPKGIAKNLLAIDNTIGIRVIKDKFCIKLIKKFKKPIVSTSANYSGDITPLSFNNINNNLLKKVDYIVNLRQQEKSYYKYSYIIKLLQNRKISILRK